MNYQKEYNHIIYKAIKENRTKGHGTYYESHHWLPKSIFPQYEKCKWNKVLLTPYEHVYVHCLLPKIFINNKNNEIKMLYAFNMMIGRNKSERIPEKDRLEIDALINDSHKIYLIAENRENYSKSCDIQFTKEDKEYIIRLITEGKSCVYIGNLFSVSRTTIKRRLIKWGVFVPRGEYTPTQKWEMIKMYEDNKSIVAISKLFNVGPSTITRRLIKWGIHSPKTRIKLLRR